MKRILYIYIILLFIQSSCVSTKHNYINNNGGVIYSVDKDGVYFYNCYTKTRKKIYSTNKVFLSNSLQFLNDSIILVGHQSKSIEVEKPRIINSKYFYQVNGDSSFITDNPPYTVIDKYSYMKETFFAINIYNSKSYKYKTIKYEKNEDGPLNIKTSSYDKKGTIINFMDTTLICKSATYTSKGIKFCGFERFYSKSEIANNKQVFSKSGDLILNENGTETILLKFDGYFDPKFGSGYINPTISGDGKKLVYQYLAGFLNQGSGIFEMNIESKEQKKLIGEGYFNPKYSPDGNSLLMAKNNREGRKKTWLKDIYIFNILTGEKNKIAEGDNYVWR